MSTAPATASWSCCTTDTCAVRRTARGSSPTGDGSGSPSLTLAEVKRLDAGSWFGAEFAGEQVPTLREWAEAIGGRAGLLIEMKHPSGYPGIEMDLTLELLSAPALVRAGRRAR